MRYCLPIQQPIQSQGQYVGCEMKFGKDQIVYALTCVRLLKSDLTIRKKAFNTFLPRHCPRPVRDRHLRGKYFCACKFTPETKGTPQLSL